ncbi:DNA transformation protein [Oceanospirillum multiglobuliferum]|uniref:Competence-specific regulator n=1 Tax=Oceanospirillum multiglobuliferum TaxID=64969 RepID=A0A1T4RBU3_9GAMM|nr:TfoX/Sxy family protein [Oceanospirillum multiglobuliferum]OPX55170.1 competence-specific regulator [Oceanospirillum multiglobuliferum]SKA13389.1 DNA transformation protein [Oceanospirillum multiglobuliferum]
MQRLRDLNGLGPKSEAMLIEAGIDSIKTLRALGAIRAFIQVKETSLNKPSLNLLYALVGALEGAHWLTIAQSQKSELIMQLEGYDELKKIFEAEGIELKG